MGKNRLKYDDKSLRGIVTVLSIKKDIPWENYIWNCKNKVVYGTILSRRLGKSLGINLFPSKFKSCTFDCIYCDCGFSQTTIHNFTPIEKIKNELEQSLEQHCLKKTPVDYITFAGNGEPTCHPNFPQIVDFVLKLRDEYFPQKPLAIFSNGTTISKKEIIESISKLDEKIFKLDAGDEKTFNLINHPNIDYSLEKIIDGLAESKLSNIKISSAVICSNIKNFDSLMDFKYIDRLRKIKPLEVHLYSIDYPSAKPHIGQVRISKMVELAHYITENIEIKVKVLQSKKSWKAL